MVPCSVWCFEERIPDAATWYEAVSTARNGRKVPRSGSFQRFLCEAEHPGAVARLLACQDRAAVEL